MSESFTYAPMRSYRADGDSPRHRRRGVYATAITAPIGEWAFWCESGHRVPAGVRRAAREWWDLWLARNPEQASPPRPRGWQFPSTKGFRS